MLDRVFSTLAGAAAPGRLLCRLGPRSPARAVAALAVTFATVVVTVLAFRVLNDAMMHNGLGGDEGYFVWGGWCITKGLTPYRDFMEFKPPLIFLTHALALKLFGFHNLQFRRFFFYFPLCSIIALQLSLVTRRVDKVLAMAFALAVVEIWVHPRYHDTALTDSESIGLAYYLFGVAFLLVRSKFRRWTRAVGAAFLSCCFFSKEPFLPSVLFTWIGCFFVGDRASNTRTAVLEYIKDTGLGAGVVVAGLCLYMVPTGAMKAYMAMVSRYAVVYRDPAQSFCVQGGVFEPTTPLNDVLRAWKRGQLEFVNVPTLGFFAPFGIAYLVYTPRRSLALFGAGALACISAFYSVTVSNCPWIHYYNLALTGLFFCGAVGVDSMVPPLRWTDRGTRALVRFAILGAVVVQIWPRIDSEREAYGQRTFPSSSEEPVAGALEAIRTRTKPGDRILTTGNPSLYVIADRVSALRESVILDPVLPFYIGGTDEEKLRPLYEELLKNRPKIVILDPQFGPRKERHRKALLDPFLRELHYEEIRPHVFLRPDG
jgi:hypothetical protein